MWNMAARIATRIRRDGRHYSLFFIRPKARTNAHRYAERLAQIKDVAEVMVTEGECGFIVKARGIGIGEDGKGVEMLARSSYNRIAGYYHYRR